MKFRIFVIVVSCGVALYGCGGGGPSAPPQIIIGTQIDGGSWYSPGDSIPVIISGRQCYIIKARPWTNDPRDLTPDRPPLGSDPYCYLTLEIANSPMTAFTGSLGLYDTTQTTLWGGIVYPVPGTPVPCTWHRVYDDATCANWHMEIGGPLHIKQIPFAVYCHEVGPLGAKLTFGN